MKKSNKKIILSSLLTSILIGSVFAGCGKTEEVELPMVEEEKVSSYYLTQAETMEVVLSDKIDLKYTQKEQADYSFPIGGYYVKKLPFKKGDTVKAGDLLAELDRPDLEEEVKMLKTDISEIDVELKMLAEQKALEYDQASRMVKSGELKSSEYDSYIAALDEKYAEKCADYENTKAYEEMRLEYYEAQFEAGKIYATMDGVVSFAREYTGSQTCVEKQRVVSLIDSAKCAFASDETEFKDVLVEGEHYTISTFAGKKYDTVYHYFEEGDLLMFELVVPDYDITIGTKADVKIEKEKVSDAVAVINSAIHHAGDKNYVYFVDENDVRHFQYIEVGLKGDTHTQILSGVKSGDILVK